MEILSIINSVILSFIFAHIMIIVLFTKEWKYRFRKSTLPIEHWKKVLILLTLFLIFFPLINYTFSNYISILLDYLGWYQLSLFFIILPTAYLMVDKLILYSPWQLRDIAPIGIIIINILLTMINLLS